MIKRYAVLVMAIILISNTVGCSKKPAELQGVNQVQNTSNKGNIQASTDNVVKKDEIKVQKAQEIKLDEATKKKLDIFFSNFSESAVPEFEKDKLSNEELILFGIRHNITNNPNYIEKYNLHDSDGRISSKYIDASVQKYFNKKIAKHQTVQAYSVTNGIRTETGNFTLMDGYYLIPANHEYQIDPARYPNGESSKYSEISKLIDNGDNIYTAYINIYATAGEDSEDYNLYEKMKATIKKESDGRYILIDYVKEK